MLSWPGSQVGIAAAVGDPREVLRMPKITERETQEIDAANASGRTPVVFVHGLWLLPSSWDRWVELFEENGYTAVAPGWPDDPETVEEAKGCRSSRPPRQRTSTRGRRRRSTRRTRSEDRC